MKELSIEEKAKAYDEAKLRISAAYNSNRCTIGFMNEIFPELQESEDERIRETIIKILLCFDHYEGVAGKDMIAWLKKQGKQKSSEITDLRTWKYIVDAVLTEREGIGQYIDSPWTTEVAKKLQKRFGSIEQEPVEPQQDMLSQEQYAKAVDECIYGEQNPAWSEEDEDMIQALNACIDVVLKSGMNYISFDSKSILIGKVKDWLKFLKDRVLLQPRQEWSEEEIEKAAKEWDSKANFNPFYMTMDGNKPTGVKQSITTHKESFKAGVNWILKFLKDRYTWKPSDEQMRVLEKVINGQVLFDNQYESLKKLLEQLKAL